MEDGDRDAYLKRLGLEAEPPSVDALFRLHRAHVARVPYETLWLQLGQVWLIDPRDSVEHVVHQNRGGYCFQVNGAFSELLRALGYDVTRHVGGVHDEGPATESSMANHLVLNVAGLPTTEIPDGIWYCDVGLGDALYEPLPLIAGDYEQGSMRFSLRETPGELADWRFVHDPRGSFRVMSWQAPPVEMSAFAAQHETLSTSPDSTFVKFPIVQRRDADGVDVMIGIGLRRVGDPTRSDKTVVITDRADWFAALDDLFGLTFERVDPAALDRLWAKMLADHAAWEAQKGAQKPAAAEAEG